MKPSLELKVSQQLTMTPQLQQAIRLLQLSSLELQQEIQSNLETNPLLEEDYGEGDEEEGEETAGAEVGEVAVESPTESQTADDSPVDTEWDTDFIADGEGGTVAPEPEEDLPGFEQRNSAPETLQDHLLWQLHMAPLTEQDRAIGEAIIEAVDDDGYLATTLEEIAETFGVDTEDVHAVHTWVLHLDPLGVAARDLGECLTAQMDGLPADTPGLELARRVASDHLEQLGKHDFKGIRRRLGVDEAELDEAVALIRSLNPRPGTAIGGDTAPAVLPDVLVRHQGDRWRVELNPEAVPRVRINNAYAEIANSGEDSEARKYIRDHLQQARWFIKSLASRNETLLKVATAIVERQQPFLEHGPTAMRPMILRDIADAVELHESTVSRVTTQKYMHTPQGVFELKYFFSSQLGTTDGEGASATAIRAMIERLVENEDPKKPYSDAKIVEKLQEQGFEVARRTVVKYRQALNLPSSSQRRRMSR
jgi:RNA polymerase sigma-54 factor